jgi:hypothetical protein
MGDALDGASQPPVPGVTTLVPSVVMDVALPSSRFTPIANLASPFNGMVLFQRRFDRRPVVLLQQQLVGASSFSGAVYAKWGHVMLVGDQTMYVSVAAGTMRVVSILNLTINPPSLMPPVQEVFLVE